MNAYINMNTDSIDLFYNLIQLFIIIHVYSLMQHFVTVNILTFLVLYNHTCKLPRGQKGDSLEFKT